MRPASIFDRSRMSLIKASKCRPAPSTRSSGSVSCFSASASSRSISLTPMMALSGRAQLVAHIGEELRFVLACFRELPTLVLYLIEQAHVFDRDHNLVGEGLQQCDLLITERLHNRSAQQKAADGTDIAHKRN